jgi:putative component of toxin-antitoxin plasmid stabilization module
MDYTITYYSEALQTEIMSLPATLQARYIGLTARMMVNGANLGEPHTKAFGDGLFELRLKGAEGTPVYFIAHWLVARSSCCIASSKRHRRRRPKNA